MAEFDYTRFAQELHSLLDAGLSVTRALLSLARFREASSGAEVIRAMSHALQKGKSISQALAIVEPAAPPLLTSLIAASEHTGNLSSALGRYVAYRERMDGLRKRLMTALLYPALLTGVGGLVIVFLLGFVVPRFAKTYEGMSGSVPFASRLIIEWGSLLRHHGGLVALVFVALLALAVFKIRAAIQARGLTALLGVTQAARHRLRDYELSRFYRTVGIQLAGGIPIVTAIESAGVLLREADRLALLSVIERLHQGIPVSAALDAAGLSSPLV
ncbi:MAG TPA: type II secretion system F family protein, partial [Rhodocyclaceae bacterium]|nr:type II secretion system F family protein [Rhodocyclaceae bacterium]